MSTTTTTTTVCPPWCVEPRGSCDGEHASEIVYLPTSGGLPTVQPGTGTTFPVVGVRASHDTIDGLAPCIDVHIDGGAVDDAQASLLVPEARRLARALLAACDLAEGATARAVSTAIVAIVHDEAARQGIKLSIPARPRSTSWRRRPTRSGCCRRTSPGRRRRHAWADPGTRAYRASSDTEQPPPRGMRWGLFGFVQPKLTQAGAASESSPTW